MAEQWFCISINPREEGIAVRHLGHRGFTVFYPQFVKPGTKRQCPMFPGYLFLNFDVATSRWQQLYATPGVKHLFMNAPGKPCPMPPEFIARIRQETDMGQWQAQDALPLAQDHVRIVDSALQEWDLEGICTKSSKDRVEVLLIRMGKLTRVAFKPNSVAVV
jgi:transcription antitermination factor NusG